MPYLRDHREHEELYLLLEGDGQMLCDGAVVDVHAGSPVRADPGVMGS